MQLKYSHKHGENNIKGYGTSVKRDNILQFLNKHKEETIQSICFCSKIVESFHQILEKYTYSKKKSKYPCEILW